MISSADPQREKHLVLDQEHPFIHHCYPLPAYLCKLCMLNINYPAPTNVKKKYASLHLYFLSNPTYFPTLLSPASLVYHQWISCNFPSI